MEPSPPAPDGTPARESAGREKLRRVIGWIAVGITAAFVCVWTYWGIIENFHEGWYAESVWENLFMLFIQYLLISIVFCALAVVAIRWRRVGLALHIAAALFLMWFFRGAVFSVAGLMIALPIALLGLLYFFGRPQPKKWAYRLLVIPPLLIILAVMPWKLIQVSQRVDDGGYSMRTVQGNGVTLVWAPRGPGWPEGGISYGEAAEYCRYLSEDGTMLMDEPQDIWRLPTVEEAVRCMALHGENAGGVWDGSEQTAVYERTPDKETPLWDPHSQVIYYWTQTLAGEGRAYIIVYDGGVYSRSRGSAYGYLSFRAVKDP
jgi:hypothetical protein